MIKKIMTFHPIEKSLLLSSTFCFCKKPTDWYQEQVSRGTCEIKRTKTQPLNTYHCRNTKKKNLQPIQDGFSFSAIAPPVFDGINYQVWAVRMEAYLDATDQWEAIE